MKRQVQIVILWQFVTDCANDVVLRIAIATRLDVMPVCLNGHALAQLIPQQMGNAFTPERREKRIIQASVLALFKTRAHLWTR